jgi:type III secretion protein Q
MNNAPNALIAPLPRNLAKLGSRLAGRDIAVPLPYGETGFILRLETAGLEYSQEIEPEIPAAQADVRLEVDGEIWEIRGWGRAAEALLAPPDGLNGELNAEDIPPELKPALLALTLEPLLDRASQALGHSFRLAWPPRSPQTKESFILPFTLTDSAGKPAGTGRARLPFSAAALSVMADLAKAFPRRPAADCSALPFSLSLCAGREAFPVTILREAEPGDVLCFSCPAKPALTLEANGQALWTASLADGKITIQGVLNHTTEEALMSDAPENIETAAAAEPQAPGLSKEDIDALEITLSLVLDERHMTIGELAALGPGHILDTTASLDAPVTIKVGGKAVGKGRLVEVGGNLGVLIASLELSAQGGDKGAA